MVGLIEGTKTPGLFKFFQKLPLLERNAAAVVWLFLMPTIRRGSLDIEGAATWTY